ncbi:MAG TPA: helix-turn-helix domain-containing protein [Verrucomicrobiae bacterium]|nr:helix-turn-helix domain-containing protein [Verrucomicrobiae bacterium]
MIFRRHIPSPPLGQFVQFFWYYEGWDGGHSMEHVLPDGAFELVINLRDESRKLFDRQDHTRHTLFRRGWISGAQSRYLVIDALPGASMIGAHFQPGGAAPFLGAPAAEFGDRVVEFDAVWGGGARDLRDELLAAKGPSAKFRVLERFLAGRLRGAQERDIRRDRVDWAIRQFCEQPSAASVAATAARAGVSHKHFIQEFRDRVGLAPKVFCRVRRFQKALAQANAAQKVNWAEVAHSGGYYDQAHLINDFRACTGLTPARYLEFGEHDPQFLPVSQPG